MTKPSEAKDKWGSSTVTETMLRELSAAGYLLVRGAVAVRSPVTETRDGELVAERFPRP